MLAAVAWLLSSALLAPARAQIACAGDCHGDGPVTIDDLLGLVDIALDAAPLSGCSAGDIDHDGAIHVDEILAAVHVALSECPAFDFDTTSEARCDPLAAPCLLPFPNDYYTVADGATPTGRRLALAAESLPANAAGAPIDPSDQNRADGWSPGSALLVRVDGLDAVASRLPGLADARPSLAADAPIVLLDATTGERHPYWAELDAIGDADESPLLMIRPARNFADGHRIVVGLRGLAAGTGAALAASPQFVAYRDGLRTTDARFEARRPAMERIFADLAAAGVARGELQLAWDFTVASTESLTGRMLAIRDDAFAALGDAAPSFTVDTVTADPNPAVRRRVEGTFAVPLFLTDGGAPGGRLVLDARGRPQRQPGTFTARYTCNLPPAAESAPARMALYGHGLLGDRGEVNGSLTRRMSADFNIAYCATDWYGLSEEDLLAAVAALTDLSAFPALPDRMQQGILAFLYLGRLMKHPQGFSAHEAFRFGDAPALKTDELYFDGNSQGAIMGGALTAVAQDFTRSVLAEAGMNYSLLLDRSVDFDDYLNLVLRPNYPRRYDRVIGIALAQLLWDRSETNGYANHITADPLPDTPPHQVLLLGAVGDHQVTEYSLRVEAATLGAAAHQPIAAAGRVVEADPGWLLTPIDAYPHAGSAYFLWDTGSPSSPLANTPPRAGHDPHDDTPNIPAVRELKHQFWRPDGAIEDVCGGAACAAPVPPENAD
ncbi:MAG: hypothetical protein SF182_28330 [Deltaproteobacteria bacterium]|nr:hypothetical protein [Deltaproteobacteria bacterium]